MTEKKLSPNMPPSGGLAYQQTVEQVLTHTQSQASGLDRAEAQARLQKTGPNALPEKKGKPAWLRFLAHFNDVLIYVLLAAAVLTAVMGHWVDTLVILGVAVINALIGHIQESNAEKSLKSIRNMLSSEARVIRNGNHETLPTTEIVPGDIIVLRAGDRIPADMRLIEAHNLRVLVRSPPAISRMWAMTRPRGFSRIWRMPYQTATSTMTSANAITAICHFAKR